MKEIKAYIHKSRVADVIQALKETGHLDAKGNCGCHNLFVQMGHGVMMSSDKQEQHYSVDLSEPVIDEYKLEFLCEDSHVEEMVDVIKQTAHTGKSKAGWIIVADVVSAISIH